MAVPVEILKIKPPTISFAVCRLANLEPVRRQHEVGDKRLHLPVPTFYKEKTLDHVVYVHSRQAASQRTADPEASDTMYTCRNFWLLDS